MRILYVALTRAKEKLIMTGAVKLTEDGTVPAGSGVFRAEGAKNYLDWVLPCIWIEKKGRQSRNHLWSFVSLARTISYRVSRNAGVKRWLRMCCAIGLIQENMFPDSGITPDEQIDYVYPFEDEGKMKLKFTVSEL